MVLYFEDLEEYEKCQVLIDFKTKILDHENTYFNY